MICVQCGSAFPIWVKIDGKRRNLRSRTRCLKCSPFGKHNTAKVLTRGKYRECEGCGKDTSWRRRLCPACRIRKRVGERREWLYGIVGTDCWKCGYDKGLSAVSVLEFHHLTDKEFPLSSRTVGMYAKSRILKEVRKCVSLCCRCHREVHCGLIGQQEIELVSESRWGRIDAGVVQSGRTAES